MTLHVVAPSPDPLLRFERARQAMLGAYADWIATRPELRVASGEVDGTAQAMRMILAMSEP